MTDDHPELTRVEFLNGMKDLAAGTYAMFGDLREEGFSESDALKLTAAYLHGLAGGKLS